MATAPAVLSIEEYLRTSYKPDMHYLEGKLEDRNLGEYDHARLQAILTAFFYSHEKAWGVRALVEQRIRVSDDRVRICDVAILRADAPREPVTITPPLICAEVLSPEDRLGRAKLVLADYLAMGVENIWLIDPIRRAAFTLDAAGLHEADPTRLVVAGTPICVDLTEAFAAID